MSEAYLGNPNLKKINTPQHFTKEEIVEYQKCAENPIYFMEIISRLYHLTRV